MLVVVVETETFQAEFLHTSELPEQVFTQAREEGKGLFSESLLLLGKALLDPGKREAFESLRLSEAIKVWNIYRLAMPEERGMPDGVPEGL